MGRTVKTVGFFVEVEVEAWEGEHAIVAAAATGWPLFSHDPPKSVTGYLNQKGVSALIVGARALMEGKERAERA